MPTTCQYLDALRAKLKLSSDNSLAHALGVARQTVSKYRQQGICMDDDVAARAAELLEIQPATVLLDMYAERTRDPRIRQIWEQIGTVFTTAAPAPYQVNLALA